ncbi:MAG: hypothetical protein WBF68_10935 [Atribacterota bacterium]
MPPGSKIPLRSVSPPSIKTVLRWASTHSRPISRWPRPPIIPWGASRPILGDRPTCTISMPVENVPVPGVHGANRLASNSLLEGLVFGHRIAQRIKETLPGIPRAPKTLNLSYHLPTKEREGFSVEGIKKEMQALMWEKVGIVRSASALKEAAR